MATNRQWFLVLVMVLAILGNPGINAISAETRESVSRDTPYLSSTQEKTSLKNVVIPLGIEGTYELDPSKDQGTLYCIKDRVKRKDGTYSFVKLENCNGRINYLLKVLSSKYTYRLFANADKIEFIGPFAAFDSEVDIIFLNGASPEIAVLAKFYDDPLSLTADDYAVMKNCVKQLSGDRAFIFSYLKRLIVALYSVRDGFTFPDAANLLDAAQTFQYADKLDATQKKDVTVSLAAIWDKLTPVVRNDFLKIFRQGNIGATNELAALLIKYMKNDLASFSSEMAQNRINAFMGVGLTVQNIARSLDLDSSLRREIIRLVFNEFSNLGNTNQAVKKYALSFMYSVLIQGDGILPNGDGSFFSSAVYKDDIWKRLDMIMPNQISSFDDDIIITRDIFNNFPDSYISAEAKMKLRGIINGQIASPANARSYFLLFSALDWFCADEAQILRIKNCLKAVNYSAVIPNTSCLLTDISYFSLNQLGGVKSLPSFIEEQNKFFNDMAAIITDSFEKSVTPQNYLFYKADVVGVFAGILKKGADFSEQSKCLLPLLKKFNPPTVLEPADAYKARLSKIYDLWQTGKVFLIDQDGMISNRPSIFDMISDFVTDHPNDWLTVIDFTITRLAEAKEYMIYINLNNLDMMHWFTKILSHEASHCYMFRRLADNLPFALINSYWSQQPAAKTICDYVTEYAMTNDREFFAESSEAWCTDSRKWLINAFANYHQGHPSMLNIFLYIGGLAKPVSDGLLTLYYLNSKGFYEREFVKAEWTGDMRQGILVIEIDGGQYVISYRDYIITKVEQVSMQSVTIWKGGLKISVIEGEKNGQKLSWLKAEYLNPDAKQKVKNIRLPHQWVPLPDGIQVSLADATGTQYVGVLAKASNPENPRNTYFTYGLNPKNGRLKLLQKIKLKDRAPFSFNGVPFLGTQKTVIVPCKPLY